MAITEVYSGTGTSANIVQGNIGARGSSLTGTNLASISNPGVYQVFLDFVIKSGDSFELRIYDKITAGGTQKGIYSAIVSGVQSSIFTTPGLILYHGWDVTLAQVAVDQSFTGFTISWSIRKIG